MSDVQEIITFRTIEDLETVSKKAAEMKVDLVTKMPEMQISVMDDGKGKLIKDFIRNMKMDVTVSILKK